MRCLIVDTLLMLQSRRLEARHADSSGALLVYHGSTTRIGLTSMYVCVVNPSLSGEGDDFISTWEEVHETFDVMGLHENLLRGIYAYGKLSSSQMLLKLF